jgi:hypothetical protein
LVPRQSAWVAAGEQAKTFVEPRGDLAGSEHVEAGGREFDRERNSVQPAADLGYVGGVVVVDGEASVDHGAAFGEQRARSRSGERRQVIGAFARDA